MHIRRFKHGDEIACHAIYYAAVHEGTTRFYSEAQRRAWAPNDTPYPEWRDRLGDAVIANTVIDDDSRGLLGEHLACTFCFVTSFSWHCSEQ